MIIRLLLKNSRSSYNELAKMLGVSINTIRLRIKHMLDLNLIRYNTIINLDKFGYTLIYLLVKGSNNLSRLSLVGKIIMHVRCLGDISVIGMAVKSIDVFELIKVLLEPSVVTLLFYKEPSPIKISKNDLEIIRYMLDNPTARIKYIAYKLGISTKTVKRRLDYLITHDLIHFSIIIEPSKLEYINFGLVIMIDDENTIKSICDIVEGNFLMSPLIYNNLVICILYSESMYEIDNYYNRLRKIDSIKSIELLMPLSIEFNNKDILKSHYPNLLYGSKMPKV